MLKTHIIKFMILLVISVSISVVTADQKKNICYKTHEKKAASLFPKPQLSFSYTELDINNDGKNEIIYNGNCGTRLCENIILTEIDGCYLAIFGNQGGFDFIDKIPKNIRSIKLFKLFKDSLDLKFKPISSFVSYCAGATKSNSIYLFSKTRNKYVEVYSESYDFCYLNDPE